MATLRIPGYNIQRSLAKGGMAEVFLADQESLGRQVAIKVMDKSNDDKDFIERFLKEAHLVASLKHPNIITIHDSGVLKDGRLYLSMEYVEGGDLDARLIEGISESEAVQILRHLAQALSFIHAKGIVHRDIKPANVLFRQDGSLVLTDFGIAKQEVEDVKLTRTGITVGSPAYCSPEQAQGLSLDQRSDIYSLGVVFLEMLLGRNPYKADSYIKTSLNHIQMEIPRLPDELRRYQRLLEQMLAKEPGDRFATVADMLVFLDKTLKKSLVARVLRWFDEHLWFTRTLAVAMVVVALWYIWALATQTLQQGREINALLSTADHRMKSENYISPAGDSAMYYYEQILAREPQNEDARQGLANIVEHYYREAAQAYQKHDRLKFRQSIQRGLSVDPDNKRLLALKEEFRKNSNPAEKLADKLSDIFN